MSKARNYMTKIDGDRVKRFKKSRSLSRREYFEGFYLIISLSQVSSPDTQRENITAGTTLYKEEGILVVAIILSFLYRSYCSIFPRCSLSRDSDIQQASFRLPFENPFESAKLAGEVVISVEII